MTHFILPALLCWLAMLAAYPLAPVAVAFATSDGTLPRWAWWLETHDNPGWQGPLSEGYPATRWGLVRWLWRNKAYTLRNVFRAEPSPDDLLYAYGDATPIPRVGLYLRRYTVGKWWEVDAGLSLYAFRLYVRAGWKLQPYLNGHRPVGPTATGMLIPFAVRTDDFNE